MGFEIQNSNLNSSDITSEKTALEDRRAMLMTCGDGQNPIPSWSCSGFAKLWRINNKRNLSLPCKEAALTCNYRFTDTQKWWARGWQFQIALLSRVAVQELSNTLLFCTSSNRSWSYGVKDRAEAQENTKTNSFSKCMHIYPVESSVKFCFRKLTDSPLTTSGAIQRAHKDNRLNVFIKDFIRILCVQWLGVRNSLN